MNSNRTTLEISDLLVELVRKDIKNVHLSVLPPDGRVRLSAPLSMTEDSARLAVVMRWSWIRKKQKEFTSQRREAFREYVNGESHYFDGQKYLLSLVEAEMAAKVCVAGNGRIELHCRADASHLAKQRAFGIFYRHHLNSLVDRTLASYCRAFEVQEPEVRIQRMRTKWGSCNAKSQRLLINLELAKKPRQCFEYILAHELAHLRVRYHNQEFLKILENVLPDWAHRRDILNSLPLAYDEWAY